MACYHQSMNFFAVLFALLIEQLKPLSRLNAIHDALTHWMHWTGRNFDAGRKHHAWVVWSVMSLVPMLLVIGVYWALKSWYAPLGLVWDILVLYVTMGFRQFSHYFTDIRDALERGDEPTARSLLAEWRHLDASELPRTELLRHVIEHSLLAAHRHVFGVFFWFVFLSVFELGPAGAVLYRMAEFASRYWGFKSRLVGIAMNEHLLLVSQRMFSVLDHFPARLTAFGFAVVGNFEEAIACWRRDAGLWQHSNEGVLLSAAAGAVGVQLGGSAAPGITPDRSKTFYAGASAELVRAEGSTPGAPPELNHLRSIVALVWRSVVLWMLLLALLSLANLIS
jgi:adenosylcobinamide-phosphate synthase